jgi:hypothetical protein
MISLNRRLEGVDKATVGLHHYVAGYILALFDVQKDIDDIYIESDNGTFMDGFQAAMSAIQGIVEESLRQAKDTQESLKG